MVLYALEENPSTQKRNLKRLYVNPYSKCVPGVRSDTEGDEGCEESVKIEEKPVDKLYRLVKVLPSSHGTHKNTNDQLNHPCPVSMLEQHVQELVAGSNGPVEGARGLRQKTPSHW